MAFTLLRITVTPPVPPATTGTAHIVVGGTDGSPVSIYLSGLGVNAAMSPAPGNTAEYTTPPLPVGIYTGGATRDVDGVALGFQFEIVIVPGCTEPDADNYDPNATQDDGSCVFTPKLSAAPLPELAPVGVPLLAVLTGQAVANALPAPATLLLDLTNLAGAAGVQVRVDGYLFTSGPLIVPGRFEDAATLLAALRAQPALAAAYTFSEPAVGKVLLTATALGLPGTPTASTSNAARVALTLTPGVAALWSQRRHRWGCYVEVWAGCGTEFGGTVDKSTAVLAQRLPLDYRADNRYEFDIAPALSQFTGHAYPLADGSSPDRLVSYFLRFGEEYARTPTGLRQVRTVYESPVAWAIEAMEVPAPISGRYVLSSRPGPWRVAAGSKAPLWQLGTPDTAARTLLRYRLATSRSTTDVVLGHQVATGQVTQANEKLLALPGALSGELRITDSTQAAGALLARLDFGASGPALTFANRQGGFDTFYFEGSADETTKRTAGGFTASGGAQLLSAEAALPTRLYSGLLDYATWAWLRRELTTSPAAWLETGAGPQLVRLTDVGTDSDTLKGEYSLTVDYETSPVRGLSN